MLTSQVESRPAQAEPEERTAIEGQEQSESESSSDDEEGEIQDEDMLDAVPAPTDTQPVSIEPSAEPKRKRDWNHKSRKRGKKQNMVSTPPNTKSASMSGKKKKTARGAGRSRPSGSE